MPAGSAPCRKPMWRPLATPGGLAGAPAPAAATSDDPSFRAASPEHATITSAAARRFFLPIFKGSSKCVAREPTVVPWDQPAQYYLPLHDLETSCASRRPS